MLLNKLCDLPDWAEPHLAGISQHRKNWEYQHLLAGLDALSAIRKEAIVLAVAAGHEPPVYTLTNSVHQVFATDIYGSGVFTDEADGRMLLNPDVFAPFPYDRRRLVVQHMDALDLRYPDHFFDIVFSLSSVEHFGGMDGAATSLREMARVAKPGGIVALTTECVVDGGEHCSFPNLELFSPETLARLTGSADNLRMTDDFHAGLSPETLAAAMPLDFVISEAAEGRYPMPHIVLEVGGRLFTSGALFLRKTH